MAVQTMPINVYSEIGRLKKVLLHKPGKELENLMPEYLERLLFDDIPYLKKAREEHDAFAEILREKGVEVVYLTDLVTESITNEEIKHSLIIDFLSEANVTSKKEIQMLSEYFRSFDTKAMVEKMMSGIRKSELGSMKSMSLSDHVRSVEDDYPFILDPIPNLYFTRDPFASVGHGVTIHKMYTETRNKETLFSKYIFKYHPEYSSTRVWYDRDEEFSLEGGDILVLNSEVIAMGISQRTSENAIDRFAASLFREENSFRKILAFNIPKKRAYMHLDTVFTMVDYNMFTIHPNTMSTLNVFVIESDNNGKLKISRESDSLQNLLSRHLKLENVTLIKCGRDNIIDASREQWNDGSNTLAIAPGEVVVYSRNYVTNDSLEEHGIKTYQIPCSELSRGRGGPRCMSMPLIRENLN